MKVIVIIIVIIIENKPRFRDTPVTVPGVQTSVFILLTLTRDGDSWFL